MDRNNHYNNDYNVTNDNNIINDSNTKDSFDNDKKSFSQRLGEANVMPTGMLSAIEDTDLAILAIEQGVHESKVDQEDSLEDR